ncbi:NAD(P)/FAD-dependent oxidoreductase [Actinosynnema sp. NPDC047251]|uniref:Putative FAD-dependent monooxygenase n=1 Tax=Saccharothrix espanaensis (strain ATCC 51144 / DSM 44229 / JCM 9112 / NBRC 15066 / NRRL 15764) TaxID=1179773 RepID=K0K5B4_SACES|nr:NAD(P)/FAD-dependent oxidoreductase [Saccharothrix espanaensis]CCH32044.1 putative FAD-dependent monooxygenase [Saccharothrix espanaensis DSM 44229]
MKALIAGAGIGGLALAAALRRAGVEVEVYERAARLRPAGTGLSVMSNGLAALRSCGVRLDAGRPIERFELLTHDGRPLRTVPLGVTTGRLGVPSVCLSRAHLQAVLLAEAGPVELGAAVEGFEPDGTGVRVRVTGGEARGDVLIGADGFHSVVRRQLAGPETPRDARYRCLLATTSFRHERVTPGYVGHYWGRGRRFGLVDLGDRVYWWATGNDGVGDGFAGWAEEVVATVAATPADDVVEVRAADRPFLRRWGAGPVTLVGDAAHPMLTSLAQGAGMAIEDAAVLAHCLTTAGDPRQALRDYENRRRARTRAMVRTSRLLSRVEQADRAAWVRDAVFRLLPTRVLVRQNDSALTWTGSAS